MTTNIIVHVIMICPESILLMLLALARANQSIRQSDTALRITHGKDAPSGKFPFLVSIQQKMDHACGGSIVTRDLVLTAAHCCFDLSIDERYEPEDLTVSVGHLFWRKGKIHSVKEAIVHEGFTLGMVGDDLAILVLKKPVVYSTNVRPVRLNPVPLNTKDSLSCVTAGWGYRVIGGNVDATTEHQLQYVEVNTIPFEECQKRLGDLEFDADPLYICVYTGGGKGTCNADSGAPLMYRERQIGVLSLGIDCNNTLPEFYTRISDYYFWIRTVHQKRRKLSNERRLEI